MHTEIQQKVRNVHTYEQPDTRQMFEMCYVLRTKGALTKVLYTVPTFVELEMHNNQGTDA